MYAAPKIGFILPSQNYGVKVNFEAWRPDFLRHLGCGLFREFEHISKDKSVFGRPRPKRFGALRGGIGAEMFRNVS